MHEAKIDTYIPLDDEVDGIEIMADAQGAQLNVLIDGMCAYRLNISRELVLKLVSHSDNKELYNLNLEHHYHNEL